MGTRGRMAASDGELKLSGRRNLKKLPAKLCCEVPDPPSGLGEEARRAWECVAAQAVALGTLAESDLVTLSRYCRLLVRWERLYEAVEAHGEVLESRRGICRRNPETAALDILTTQLTQLEREFGLTPTSRTSLGRVAGKEEHDPDGILAKIAQRCGASVN